MVFDASGGSGARIGSAGTRDGADVGSGGATVPSEVGSVAATLVEASAVEESAFSGGSGRHSSFVQLQLGQTHFRELKRVRKNQLEIVT